MSLLFLEAFKEDHTSLQGSIFNPVLGHIFQSVKSHWKHPVHGIDIEIKDGDGKQIHGYNKSNDSTTRLYILLFPPQPEIEYTVPIFTNILTTTSYIKRTEESEYVNKTPTPFEEYIIINGNSIFKEKEFS